MTKYDLKEYLDKVYGVKVMNIKLTTVGYQKYKFPTPWIKGGYKWEFMDPYHEAHVYLVSFQLCLSELGISSIILF